MSKHFGFFLRFCFFSHFLNVIYNFLILICAHCKKIPTWLPGFSLHSQGRRGQSRMLLGLLSTWSTGCGCSHSPTRRWLHRGGSGADHCFLRNGQATVGCLGLRVSEPHCAPLGACC